MPAWLTLILPAGLLLLGFGHLGAQTSYVSDRVPGGSHGFVVESWTTEDGLPQNTVNDILETRDGRLWIATFGGLARFDGTTFDILGVADLPELGSNRILSLAEAAAGGIWVFTSSREILRIADDRVLERIEAPSLGGLFHHGLRVGADGELILGTFDAVHVFGDGQWLKVLPGTESTGPIRGIDVDPEGQIWVATWGGLERLVERDLEPEGRMPPSDRSRVPTTAVRSDPSGRLWHLTPDGVAFLDPGRGDVVDVRVEELESVVGQLTAIEVGADDGIWVGGRKGLAHLHVDLDRGSAEVLYSMRSPGERAITRILADRGGAIWVGTGGNGLSRLAPRRVLHLTEADGLPIREVNHIVPSPEGGVRLAGACKGVAEVLPGDPIEVRALDLHEYGNCSTGLAVDSERNLWVAFRGTGSLVRVPSNPGEQVRAWGPEDGIDPMRQLVSPVVAPDGGVWFGYGRGGLGYVRDTTISLYDPGFGLPAEEISSLVYDSTGSLWVGLSGKVAVIPVSGSQIGEVRLLGREEGVPPGSIRAILRDRSGDVWIGSYGGGLARCNEDGSSFNRLTSEHGLPDNSVSALIEDSGGRFWILGNRGVSVVPGAVLDSVIEGSRSRLDAVLFDGDDGMPEGNGGSPAAWLSEDGVAWFATIDGLVSIETGSFPWDTVGPVPRIESVRFGEEQWTGTGPIVVGGGDREVAFRYSASSTATLSRLIYRYRLVGQDQTWVYSERSGEARYPRVPPGDFSFIVEARNEDGVWSARPESVDFRILPLWWQTDWFRWTAGLLAAGLVAGVLFRRVRLAEHRALRLEFAIEERDRAEERARRHQRELEHVSRVATAGELATSLAHELNQPLMAIVSNAAAGDKLLSNPDLGKEVVREALEEIMHEGRRASDVIKELRAFLKRGVVDTEPLGANQLVRDVLLLLGSEIREVAADVALELAGELPDIIGNRVQLQQVLINLIMNSLDAMREQETEKRLLIRSRSSDSGVELTVQDSGPGFPPDQISEIFEAFVTTKSTGMGVGLAISRSLVQAHGGRIEAENVTAGGARIRVTLPAAPSGSRTHETVAEPSATA
ncbi:MAG: ATP-binding protein [marine benthic group bacterium]|nr:ATP-binding protein [Gemmatimonadota bacterium]MCL7989710.1 ATP-binding protein [Gemmatimonadota bacterium]